MDGPYGSVDKTLDEDYQKSQLQSLIDVKSDSSYCGSWVPFLALELGIPFKSVTNYAMGSQGNQMIARNIVHGVEELLAKNIPTKDILVGVAWSGISRGSAYSSDVGQKYFEEDSNKVGWMHNPVQFLEESDRRIGWKIFNHHWGYQHLGGDRFELLHEDSASYYNVFNEVSTFAIETAERIHWVQEYLNGKGIDYFFTNMSKRASIFGSDVEEISDNHVKKTVDLIDRSKFCEWLGIAEWQAYYMNTYVGPTGAFDSMVEAHPSTYTSYCYVKDQILPYLEKNYLTHS